MRQLFSVFLFSFASLFFSQCEIGEISFALEDVLMFFKVEERNKKNEIQEIDKFELEAAKKPANVVESIDEIEIRTAEKPENEIQGIDKFELEAAKKPANIVESVDGIELEAKEKPANIVESVDGIELEAKEKPANVVESIDEIELEAKEKPENGIQKIAEIELKAKEKEQNIIQNIQKISIPAKQRHENEIQQIESIELLGIEKPQINPEKINDFCLQGVVKPEKKIEKKDEILIEGNNDEEVINANLNVNPEETKTTPRYNLSNKRNSFLSGSTTASKNSYIDDFAYKKGVLNSDENLSTLRHGLIHSFNAIQAEKNSCYNGEIIKKQGRRVNNIDYGEGKLKQEGSSEHRNLIKKKIEKQENQERTLYYVRKKKDSSIFVLRHESIENNKKSQGDENIICKEVKNSRIGKKKDVHKNVNTNAQWGFNNVLRLLNLNIAGNKTNSDKSKLHFNILQKKK